MIDRAALLAEDTDRSAEALETLLDAGLTVAPVDGAIRFVGLGSSRFAALVVASILAGQGRAVRVETAAGIPLPALPGETCFVISASGRTAEVVAACEQIRGAAGPVIAVTNDAASPLAGAADTVIGLHAGAEASGIATLTFRATIVALALATGAESASGARSALAQLRAAVASREWSDAAAQALDGADAIDVVAASGLLGGAGVAEQVALMLREGPRLRAVAWDAAEWLHTAIYTALPGHRVLAIGQPAAAGVRVTVEGRSGHVVELPGPAAGDPLAAALAWSVAGEQLAAALWTRVSASEVKGA